MSHKIRISKDDPESLFSTELSSEEKTVVDRCIERLLSVQRARPRTEVHISEEDIVVVCRCARSLFLAQPTLLELDGPISVCGDIHGQFFDLLRIFEMNGFPSCENGYLFLGDYVDRASQSIETIVLLLCYKLRYQQTFFLLRGNHECSTLNRIYGFFDECKRRYSVRLWRIFGDCFNCMPAAAIIASKIFCCHGGLSPELDSLERIREIQRPTEVQDEGLLCDLLWAPTLVNQIEHRKQKLRNRMTGMLMARRPKMASTTRRIAMKTGVLGKRKVRFGPPGWVPLTAE